MRWSQFQNLWSIPNSAFCLSKKRSRSGGRSTGNFPLFRYTGGMKQCLCNWFQFRHSPGFKQLRCGSFHIIYLFQHHWICIRSDQISRSVSNSLQPHESQHARPPCPSPTPGVHSDSHPSSRWICILHSKFMWHPLLWNTFPSANNVYPSICSVTSTFQLS